MHVQLSHFNFQNAVFRKCHWAISEYDSTFGRVLLCILHFKPILFSRFVSIHFWSIFGLCYWAYFNQFVTRLPKIAHLESFPNKSVDYTHFCDLICQQQMIIGHPLFRGKWRHSRTLYNTQNWITLLLTNVLPPRKFWGSPMISSLSYIKVKITLQVIFHLKFPLCKKASFFGSELSKLE